MWLEKIPLQFWRRSRSDPTKPSYMEQGASIAPDDFDVITEHRKRAVCNVQWGGKLPNTVKVLILLDNFNCLKTSLPGIFFNEIFMFLINIPSGQ